MSGPVKQFVDYSNNTASDTGENNTTSIQPIVDGNPNDAANLSRPDESLRQRTEAVRTALSDTLFLRDADRSLILSGPGTVTWPGSTTVAASGIFTLSDVLYLLPMLTPGFAQTNPVPPVASAFGTLHLKRADSLDSILVTSQRRSYANGDQINIDVVAGGSFSCTLDTEAGYRRTIHIVATGATQLSTVITALNGLTPPAPDNTALVSAALENGALGTDFLLSTQAKQFVVGNYDGEGHTITPANLAAFFSGNPTSALAEGDTLGITFAMLSDTASTGGRRQALPENSNTAVPVGSFFNSRIRPDLLVNALPICKVVNGRLVFGTGSEVAAGGVNIDLSTTAAASISYAGGPAWADGTTNPGTTVEAQLDKIVSDLAGATGTGKIMGSAVASDLGAKTLALQITDLVNNWLKTSRANTITGVQTFSAGIIANAGMTVGVNQHVAVSGTGKYKRGTRVRKFSPLSGHSAGGTFPTSTGDAVFDGRWVTTAGGDKLALSLDLEEGETLTQVVCYLRGDGIQTLKMDIVRVQPGISGFIMGSASSVAVLSNQAVTVSGLTEVITAGDGYSYTASFIGDGSAPATGIQVCDIEITTIVA